jgi:glucose dehydrogenase
MARLRNAGTSGEEWLSYGLDLGEKRFSPLPQIDATNVTRLESVWSFDIPGGNSSVPGGGNQEATLLASNGVLYGITT